MKGQKTKDSLGDRMKLYEGAYRNYLPRRLPVIIRIDGCHFHTFTRGLKKPFDKVFMNSMIQTTKSLCENIMGCKFGYTQSDEISLLLTNNDTFETQPWFDNNINKIVSVSASMASMFFNKYWIENTEKFYNAGVLDDYNRALYDGKANTAYFDARVFVVPPHEVNNYFIWRQQDATRNSILGCAQSLFSHKEIEGINTKLLQDKMLREKDFNWNNLITTKKRGIGFYRDTFEKEGLERSYWKSDYDIPIFTQDKDYIRNLYLIED